jgi:peroxiredoxin
MMENLIRNGLLAGAILMTVVVGVAVAQDGPAPVPAVRPGVLGLPMPDFLLPAIQGGAYGPSALKGKNVLIVFPRGKVDDTWCWICPYQYSDLAEAEARLGPRKAYNLEILFILPCGEEEVRHWVGLFPSLIGIIEGRKNPPDLDKLDPRGKIAVQRMRQFFPKTFDFGKNPAPTPLPILYDRDQAVSKMLGLFTTDWDESAVDQNVPTVFLLNASGEIIFKYRSQITFDRPNADYLVKIMDKLILNK